MPFVYSATSIQQGVMTTSGTPNTEIDHTFHKPGSARACAIQGLYVQGKGAGLTALSGIIFRLKKWTTTASSGGTSVTPTPHDEGMQACKATCGFGTSGGTAAVTSGTGGPTYLGAIGCGAAGPGGWVAPNPDSVKLLEAGGNKSIDLFSASGTASLSWEATIEHVE